ATTNPDLRVVIDFSTIQRAFGDFQYYELGKWMQFGEFHCGDRNLFKLIVKDRPEIRLEQWTSEELPAVRLQASLNSRAELNGCFGDPRADASITLSASIGALSSPTIPVTGTVHIDWGFFKPNASIGTSLSVPVDISSVPVTVSDGPAVKLE